jgi:hypothetical protein
MARHFPAPMSGRSCGSAIALSFEITFWIDRPRSFLQKKKFHHHRHQLGWGVRISEVGGRENWRTYLRVAGHLRESRRAAIR